MDWVVWVGWSSEDQGGPDTGTGVFPHRVAG